MSDAKRQIDICQLTFLGKCQKLCPAMERNPPPIFREITDYAKRVGISPSTVCARAVNNGHLYRRLESGGDCSTRVAERLRNYMAANPERASA